MPRARDPRPTPRDGSPPKPLHRRGRLAILASFQGPERAAAARRPLVASRDGADYSTGDAPVTGRPANGSGLLRKSHAVAPGTRVAGGSASARVSAAWISVIGRSANAWRAGASKVMSSVSIAIAARAWRAKGAIARRSPSGT